MPCVASLPPHTVCVCRVCGSIHFMQQRCAEAEPLLLASLELNLAHPEANLFAGLCAARRDADATALTLLERAHTYAPHNAEIVRDYGAMLVRLRRPREARRVLARAVAMLEQLHRLGERSAHGAASLGSAHVKLAAALLGLNRHAECAAAVRAAVAVQPSLRPAVQGLLDVCERAPREGLDTSKMKIEMSL